MIRLMIFIGIYLGLFTLSLYFIGFLDNKTKKIKKVTKYPFVSILVPAYNEEETLKKTVDSLLDLEYPKNKIEIIIINDGSKDRTLDIAEEYVKKHKNVRVFTKENGGKASALNYGMKYAKGELIASFDADSMATKGALIRMIPYFVSDKKIMCVTPALKVDKPRGILQFVQAIEYDLGIFLRKAFTNYNSVHVTPGPLSVYRAEFFKKHGGYDEGNITEDMEMALRIQSLHYKIENSMHSIVYTVPPKTFTALLRQRRRWYAGLMRNFWHYRKLIGTFSGYGELGGFVLPMAIFSILSAMTLTIYYASKAISNIQGKLDFYSSIGFDFMRNIEFSWPMISLYLYNFFTDNIILFTAFFFFYMLILVVVINAKVKSKDNPAITLIAYVFFILFYSLLYTFWWIISIFYTTIIKKVDW